MALDALHDAGVKPDDPAFAAALKFVSRCQNFSETNSLPWAGDDGGFIYTPANGGSSPAGEFVGVERKALAVQLRLDDLRGAEEHDLCRAVAR